MTYKKTTICISTMSDYEKDSLNEAFKQCELGVTKPKFYKELLLKGLLAKEKEVHADFINYEMIRNQLRILLTMQHMLKEITPDNQLEIQNKVYEDLDNAIERFMDERIYRR